MTASNPTPLPPGDRRRFSDPAAAPVYAAIKSLDLASQHDILRRLQVKLHAEDVSAEGTQKTRLAHALTALGEAKRRLGHSPSVEEYRKLYREGMRDAGWPDDRCIRRCLGAASWNDALRRAHLEPLAEGDVVVFQHRHFYTREELIAALRECRDDLSICPATRSTSLGRIAPTCASGRVDDRSRYNRCRGYAEAGSELCERPR